MGDQIPGPICSTKLGGDWIDKGTTSLTRNSAPGPLGTLMSMVMGATPLSDDESVEKARAEWRKNQELEKKQEKEKLEKDTPNHVKKCIANLKLLSVGPGGAWRSVAERDLVLNKLEALNNERKISWEAGEDRGGHDHGLITVNLDLHAGTWEQDAWMRSAPVLVHEGVHATWGSNHYEPWRAQWKRNRAQSCKDHPKGEALIAEEMYAWDTELLIYAVLSAKGLSDMELNARQTRKSAGSLEAMVREAYPNWMSLK